MYVKGNVPRICERCGAAFTTWPGQIRLGKGRFCGKSCSSASRKYPGVPRTTPKPAEERFWPKVEKTDSCWIWTGSKSADGYGSFKESPKKNIPTHRFSWQLRFGPIPKGMKVLHRCDNPPCCNPDHLFLGTDADNAHDRTLKGRNGTSPLSAEDVIAIRRRRRNGEMAKDLAAEYGMSPGAIFGIIRRKTWSHVKDD